MDQSQSAGGGDNGLVLVQGKRAYGFVPEGVINDRTLSHFAVRVYAYLNMRAGRAKRRAWPGVERVAEDLGVTTRYVSQAMGELETRYWIVRTRRYMRSSMTYVFEDQRDCIIWRLVVGIDEKPPEGVGYTPTPEEIEEMRAALTGEEVGSTTEPEAEAPKPDPEAQGGTIVPVPVGTTGTIVRDSTGTIVLDRKAKENSKSIPLDAPAGATQPALLSEEVGQPTGSGDPVARPAGRRAGRPKVPKIPGEPLRQWSEDEKRLRAMFSAMVKATGQQTNLMTKGTRGFYNKVASEFVKMDLEPEVLLELFDGEHTWYQIVFRHNMRPYKRPSIWDLQNQLGPAMAWKASGAKLPAPGGRQMAGRVVI